MGIQLHLERLQLGLRQMFFQRRSSQFPLAVLAVIIKSVAHRNDDPVDKQIEMPRLHQQGFEYLLERGLALPLSYPGSQHHVSERKENAGDGVCGEAAPPGAAFQSKPPRQMNDRDREQRKDVPVCQREVDGLLPTDLQPCLGAGNVKLAREGKAQQRPKEEAEHKSAPPFCSAK